MGILSTVLFAPEDLGLVRGEPAGRRAYMDTLLVQRRPRLRGVISDYDKIVRQRNALLKSASLSLRHGYHTAAGASALGTLDAWDAQLAHVGEVGVVLHGHSGESKSGVSAGNVEFCAVNINTVSYTHL